MLAALLIALTACSDGNSTSQAGCENAKSVLARLDPVIGGDLAAFNLLEEPVSLPLFEFADREGNRATTADFSGKTVLLNLWATWCAPCREEMPALDALQDQLGGNDFQVLPVSIDRGGPEKPLNFYQEIAIKHLPFFQDETMGIFNELKKKSLAFGLPATLLIDADGCVVGKLNGPADWAGEDAVRLVKTAIGR